MALVVKISKPGFDVLGESDPNNLIFDGEINHLKTSEGDSYTQTVSAFGNSTKTITHSLGYKPLAMAYFRDTSNNNWYIANSDPEDLGGRYVSSNCSLYVDDTFVYMKLDNNSASSKEYEVRYEIFYEGDV